MRTWGSSGRSPLTRRSCRPRIGPAAPQRHRFPFVHAASRRAQEASEPACEELAVLTITTLLVTGGAGFIGSAVIRHLLAETDIEVINADKLTYAANPDALAGGCREPALSLRAVDVCDRRGLDRLFARYRPDAVMHLAAESHVDRSVDSPAAFIHQHRRHLYPARGEPLLLAQSADRK